MSHFSVSKSGRDPELTRFSIRPAAALSHTSDSQQTPQPCCASAEPPVHSNSRCWRTRLSFLSPQHLIHCRVSPPSSLTAHRLSNCITTCKCETGSSLGLKIKKSSTCGCACACATPSNPITLTSGKPQRARDALPARDAMGRRGDATVPQTGGPGTCRLSAAPTHEAGLWAVGRGL